MNGLITLYIYIIIYIHIYVHHIEMATLFGTVVFFTRFPDPSNASRNHQSILVTALLITGLSQPIVTRCKVHQIRVHLSSCCFINTGDYTTQYIGDYRNPIGESRS